MLAIHLGTNHFGCFVQMVACGSKSHLSFLASEAGLTMGGGGGRGRGAGSAAVFTPPQWS